MSRPDMNDLVAGAGILLIGFGVNMIYTPAALIVVGVIFLALGLAGAVRKGSSR